MDKRIVPVVAAIAEFAVAEQEMDHEQQHDDVMAEDGVARQVDETGAEALLEAQLATERLKQDQSTIRRQRLGLEAEGVNLINSAMDGRSAIFHVQWPPRSG